MKSAEKARSNGLYRHIRTSKEIIRNLLNDYRKYIAVFCFSHRCEGICRLRAAGAKGIFSFAKENIPFGTPRERLLIGSPGLE